MALPLAPLGATGLSVSRLGLGTAEIGFAYGIGPTTLPSEEEAQTLLRAAYDLGITFFDTAHYYGLAEERIRVSGLLERKNVVVCTKCAQFLEKGEMMSADERISRIRAEVKQSQSVLGLETLPLLLLHGPSADMLQEGGLTTLMGDLVSEGAIRFWGVSTRGVEAPLAAIEQGADVIQIASSIGDRRMEPVFAVARERNVGVINRSVYLKGVFAGRASYLPETLQPLRLVAEKAADIASGLGISLPDLALRYILSEEAISTILVGTARPEHLTQAASALSQGPLPSDVVALLRAEALTDPEQVDPARWPSL